MNDIFISVLLTSAAASLVGVLLLVFKPLYRGKLTKAWQYYIWLIVLARLLVPYSPAIKMPMPEAKPPQKFDASVTADADTAYANAPEAAEMENEKNENITQTTGADLPVTPYMYSDEAPKAAKPPKQDYSPGKFDLVTLDFAGKYLWVIWIFAAAALFALKTASYLRYVSRVKKSAPRIADEHILSAYAEICGLLKIKRAPEIYAGDVSSPMLIGVIWPVIILPRDYRRTDESAKLILKHELTHFLRKDTALKWLTQMTVCIHFFNPLVYVFAKEISKNCELSCDDAVLDTMEALKTRSYGDALIAVAGIASDKKGASAAAMMSSEGKFLKKRLEAIMSKKKNIKKHSVISLFTAAVVLALAVFSGCALSGVKPNYEPQNGAAANAPFEQQRETFETAPIRVNSGLGKIVGIYSDASSYGAIDEDGKVYVWGSAPAPRDLPPIQKIAFCDYGVIALGEDGKLYGWRTELSRLTDGDDTGAMGFLSDTYKDMTFTDIAAGGYNTTAVSSDGKVYAWDGKKQGDQKGVPAGLPPIVSIYRSIYATTALDADGNVYRWGNINANSRQEFDGVTARMVAP
ncbi:MAG: hypothetical protein FWD23_10420, partial [Oscillospiraceae bacterium]|nr:hypothetical protein [Oscillospiraceae bacterium]